MSREPIKHWFVIGGCFWWGHDDSIGWRQDLDNAKDFPTEKEADAALERLDDLERPDSMVIGIRTLSEYVIKCHAKNKRIREGLEEPRLDTRFTRDHPGKSNAWIRDHYGLPPWIGKK